ncbi:MAG: transposase [Phycisphaerae bacterium]
MPRQRRNFTGAEKMVILREHLIEKVPISEVCDKHGLQPAMFCQWQKRLFEDGAAVFGRPRRLVGEYVAHYNTVRLHSAIGYVTPADKLEGREQEIFAARDLKLEEARQVRKARRQAAREQSAAVRGLGRRRVIPLQGEDSPWSRNS